jgi:hypothetical protein
MNHRIIRPLAALSIGLLLALYAYHRVTDPEPARQRAIEEAVVLAARGELRSYVAPGAETQIVDPLSPNSKVGKVYIYPTGDGWEISGHYRRNESDNWHPFLMALDAEAALVSLTVRDGNGRLLSLSAQDPKFTAIPPANP